jgi:flagellar basal body-associated protein FliL
VIGIILTLPLIVLLLTAGVVLPWLGLRLDVLQRINERLTADLDEKTATIADQAATIAAYRIMVASGESFATNTSLHDLLDGDDVLLHAKNPISA